MNTYVTIILTTIFIFLTPLKWMFVLSLYLVIFDSVFAMFAKKHINRKRKKNGLEPDLSLSINSSRFAKIIPKMIMYYSSIFMGYLLDLGLADIIVGIIGNTIAMPFTYMILLIILVREIMSVNETLKLVNSSKGIVYYSNMIYNGTKLFKEKITELFTQKKK